MKYQDKEVAGPHHGAAAMSISTLPTAPRSTASCAAADADSG